MKKILFFVFLLFFVVNAYAQAPVITSFSPAEGPVGTLVTITGTNLNGSTACNIGGVNAIIISNTSTSLVGMVMPNAITGNVSLTSPGGSVTGTGTFTLTATPSPVSQQGSKITDPAVSGIAYQGKAIALSADGNTAIVSGSGFNDSQGAAWIYVRNGNTWVQQGNRITSSEASQEFASSVALSADGNTALIGEYSNSNRIGAVWVFTRSNGSWSQQQKLVGTSHTFLSRQGISVSLSADGNTAAFGGNGDNGSIGAVWIFTRSNGTWTQSGNKLIPNDNIGSSEFGFSVSLSADASTIVVGGNKDNTGKGAAWIFTKTGGNWLQSGRKIIVSGASSFGYSTAINADGTTIVVGEDAHSIPPGAGWVFAKAGNVWAQQGTLVGGDYNGDASLGTYVALTADGSTAILGAQDDAGKVGAAWLYKRSAGIWAQSSGKIVGSANVGASNQGTVALSADGSAALVGGPGDNGDAGASWAYFIYPDRQAREVNFTNATTGLTINWANGSGSRRAVFVSAGTTGSPAIVDNAVYTANSVFGTAGAQIGTSGWYCVYNGAGSSATITGLSPGTTYRVMVSDYNSSGAAIAYLTSAASNNPANILIPALPTIAGLPVTSLSSSQVTINSTVTDGGGQTTVKFLFSTDQATVAAGGGATATDNLTNAIINAGTGSATSSARVNNLSPNVTYYYMAQASNSSSTVSGTVESFTTPPPAFDATTLTLSGQSAKTLSFNWVALPGAASYTYDIATSPGFGPAIVSGYNNVSTTVAKAVITGLTTGTSYYFRIKAVNGGNESAYYVLPVTTLANPDFTATYNFNSAAGVTPDPTPVPVTDNVTFGSFTAAGVTPVAAGNGSPMFNAINWSTNAGIEPAKYFSVTITPVPGLSLSLTKLAFTIQRLNASGPDKYSVRSSLDNYMSDLPGLISPANPGLTVSNGIFTDNNATSAAQMGSNITLGSSFANLTSAVTFRIYGFAAADAANGQFGIDNVVFTGTTHALATVTTVASTISSNTATLGGNVTADGGSSVTERGIVYNTTGSPAVTADTKVAISAGTGVFSQQITGLIENKVYYAKAYAITSAGVAYGNEVNFTTPSSAIITSIALAPGSHRTNAASVQYTVTFNESITGLAAGNFFIDKTGSINGESITEVSGSGTTWTVTVNTGTGDGNIGLNLINAANIFPGVSNTLPFTGPVYTIDKTAPAVVSINPAGSLINKLPSQQFNVTFSESITGLTAANFDLTTTNTPGGTVLTTTGISSIRGTGTTYVVTVAGVAGDGTLRLDLKPSQTGFTDAAGNKLTAGYTNGGFYTIRNTPPAASILIANNLIAGNTSSVTITFDESVTGLDNSALTVTNGALSNVSSADGGQTWAATLTPPDNTTSSTNTITLNNSKVVDAAGNTGVGITTSANYTIDTQIPTLTSVTIASGNTGTTQVTTGDYVTVSFTASEAIDLPTVTIDNQIAAINNTGGNTYTAVYRLVNTDTEGTLPFSISFKDAAGNAGTIVTATTDNSRVAFRNVPLAAPSAPVLARASDSGTSHSDGITNVNTPTFTGTAEAGTTVVLYDTDGITSLGTATATGGDNWSVTSSMLTEGVHTLTAKEKDAIGNISTASSGIQVTIDTTIPALTITSSAAALRAGETAAITFTFSEDPGNTFTWDGIAGNVIVSGGTLDAVLGSGLTRTATFTPAAGVNSGTGNIIVAAAAYADAAGNSGAEGLMPAITFDTQAPTLTLVEIASGNTNTSQAKAGDAVTLNFTASEAINSPTVTIDNQTARITNNGGNSYTATYTLANTDAEGVLPFSIAFTDAAGNTGTTVTATTNSSAVVFDRTAPNTPVNLTAAGGDSQVVLSWAANTETDLAKYNIYAGTSPNPAMLLTTLAAGTITYTATGLTNGTTYYYRGSATDAIGNESDKSADVTVTPTASQSIVFDPLAAKTYGDADFALSATASSGLAVSYTSSDPAVASVSGNIVRIHNAGTVTIMATQAGNAGYTAAGSTSQTLTINPEEITVAADAKNITYGDINPVLTYQITNGRLKSGDNFTGSLSREGDDNVGIYQINQGSLSLNTNYRLNYTPANLKIDQRAIEVTADAKSKTYGDADPGLTYQITNGSLVGGDSFTGSLGRIPGEDVGIYPINQGSLALNNNYNLIYNISVNLNIVVKPITVKADAQTKTYGDADPVLTYTFTPALVTGDSFSGSLLRVPGENAGDYAINQGSLLISANYRLTYEPANFKIDKRTIEVTADVKSKTYGDADPGLTYQITNGNLLNNDSFSGSLLRVPGENAGDYAINRGSLSLNSNYRLTYEPANFKIDQRTIEVTADAKSKTYGDADPILTYRITSGSLVSGDDFTGSLGRMIGEDAGIYAINQGSLAINTNYNITYHISANLNITAKAIAVTADAKTKIYGDADPALTYTFTPALITGDSFTGGLSRTAGENVGDYAINQGSLQLSSNYTINYTGTNLSITKRAVAVTADAQTKVFGNADPALTYQISSGNLVTGDGFSGALSRTAGEAAGTYAINQGSLTLSGNYTLGYTGSTLTITAASTRTVTFTTLPAKTYGDADFAPGGTASTGETLLYSSSDASVASIVNGKIHIVGAGTATITATAPANNNYTGTLPVSEFLIVNKANQTISFGQIPQQMRGTSYDLSVVTTSAGLPVSFTTRDAMVATVTGSKLNAVGLGTTEVIASAQGNANYNAAVSVVQQLKVIENPISDNIIVHQAFSPNGDGLNDVLNIAGITDHPDNMVTIADKNGAKMYEMQGYDNSAKGFDGRSNITGKMLPPGTYFYFIQYKGFKKSGYLIIKY